MNKFFYSPLTKENKRYSIAEEGFVPPYDVSGEVELQFYWGRYYSLNNNSNHLMKTRCLGIQYGGLAPYG
jgi:hypothetical protein